MSVTQLCTCQVQRFFVLQQIDLLWREHLQAMNALKESVNLRSYAQKDPLIEYKNEGYDMFLDMMDRIRANVLRLMFTFKPSPQPAPQTAPQAASTAEQQHEPAEVAPLPRYSL